MVDLLREFQRAARGLVRAPTFALIAIATLTLGIGATTAIYTVVHSVLLEPLPYPDPERLVVIQEANPDAGFPRFAISPLNFRDYRAMGQSFEAMAARTGVSLALGSDGGQAARRLNGQQVTHEYLKVFGVQPQLGRDFTENDDRPGAPRVVLLGHSLWQSLGGDPTIVGQELRIDGQPTTVIGVLPEVFGPRVEALVPLGVDYEESGRGGHWLIAFGRLKDDASVEQARADLRGVAANLAETYPDSNVGWTSIVDPLHERAVQGVRSALWILLAAVSLVLLIACANVANLTLTRLSARGHQVAVRSSLGAGRWQLLRPMLAESVVIALVSGTLGCVLAVNGTQWLVAMNADSIPRAASIAVDGGVLLFAMVICLAATLLFGVLPALQASRPNLVSSLKDGGRGSVTARQGRLRAGLVLGEVALAMVLLVGAGLLIKSFAALIGVEPGFDPDSVWTGEVNLPDTNYEEEDTRITFYRRLLDEAQGLPAVEQVGLVFPLPLSGSDWINSTYLEDEPIPPRDQAHSVNVRFASSGYFAALGIPIERGRGLAPSDDAGSTPVVVVNNSAARHFWPDDDPVGRRIHFGRPDGNDEDRWYTVVGVVGDVHHEALQAAVEPAFYRSILQDAPSTAVVVLRTRNAPEAAAGPLRQLVQGLDPDLPLAAEQTARQLIDNSVAQPRFNMTLLALFAGLALLLAGIGVFGVVSYTVSQRLRELGVRLALGARGGQIVALVIAQGMRPVLGGMLVGLAGAFAATRLLQSLIYGISTTDPLTFATVLALLAAVATVACLAPAVRALRIDPIAVLRDD